MTTLRRVETLTRERSLELLDSSQVGRVSFSDQGLPAILPVTYVLDRDSVVVRTAAGSRLARAAAADMVMAFETDDLHTSSREGWSVLVVGEARVEDDATEHRRLEGRLHAWVPGFKDVWVRIAVNRVTGRQLVDRPAVITLPGGGQADSWRETEGWQPPTRTRAESANEFDGR